MKRRTQRIITHFSLLKRYSKATRETRKQGFVREAGTRIGTGSGTNICTRVPGWKVDGFFPYKGFFLVGSSYALMDPLGDRIGN